MGLKILKLVKTKKNWPIYSKMVEEVLNWGHLISAYNMFKNDHNSY